MLDSRSDVDDISGHCNHVVCCIVDYFSFSFVWSSSWCWKNKKSKQMKELLRIVARRRERKEQKPLPKIYTILYVSTRLKKLHALCVLCG